MEKSEKESFRQDDLEYSCAFSAVGMFLIAVKSGGVSSETANKMFDYILNIFVKNKSLTIEWLFYICVEQCHILKLPVDETMRKIRELLGNEERVIWFLENFKNASVNRNLN